MRKFFLAAMLAGLALTFLPAASYSAPAPPGGAIGATEAQVVARNWVALIVRARGAWAGSADPQAGAAQELRRGGRLLGYFVPVTPTGYVVISLRRELEPVKAYSDESNLDPNADQGMAALIKDGLGRVLDVVESRAGPARQAASADVVALMEVDYRPLWQELEMEADAFAARIAATAAPLDYQAGQNLLTSNWHQRPPYNDQTPWMNCSNSNGRALVGCVATAGAQIMYYWSWPAKTVQWWNMGDDVTTASPQQQIDEVAGLSHDVGAAVGMHYGCTSSDARTLDMAPVYEGASYAHIIYEQRDRYSASAWFQLMQTSFSANVPIHYRILTHSIVADGWRAVGTPPLYQYHMNYGWNDPFTTWYTLDALHQPGGGDPSDEYMLRNILPVSSLGPTVAGVITTSPWLYRYANQDATVNDAEFRPGVRLQFLPGVRLRPTGWQGGSLRFYGAPGQDTLLFSRGDETQGIKIYDGGIKINGGAYAGSIGFPPR